MFVSQRCTKIAGKKRIKSHRRILNAEIILVIVQYATADNFHTLCLFLNNSFHLCLCSVKQAWHSTLPAEQTWKPFYNIIIVVVYLSEWLCAWMRTYVVEYSLVIKYNISWIENCRKYICFYLVSAYLTRKLTTFKSKAKTVWLKRLTWKMQFSG